MRKKSKLAVFIMAASLLVSGSAYGQAIFLARKALGAISHLTGQGTSQDKGPEVATVLLEAKADKVYHTAIEVLKKNPKIKITFRGDADRTIEFTHDQLVARMKVTGLQEDLTQLMVACSSTSGKGEGTSLVLDGVLRVCKEMGVNCTLAKD